MHSMTLHAAALACLLTIPPAAAFGQDTHTNGVHISNTSAGSGALFVTGNSSLQGKLCVGNHCTVNEFDGLNTLSRLRINAVEPWVDFIDADTGSGGTRPGRDWRLLVNDAASAGIERFSIQDLTGGTIPFTLEGAVPDNALYVAASGNVGLGTSLPQANLHVIGGTPAIRLEETTFNTVWEIRNNTGELRVRKENGFGNFAPFIIKISAPPDALVLTSGGAGIGTSTPDAPLEISDNDTFSFFRITATGAASTKSADIVFTEGPLGTGEFRYNLVDGDGPEMRLNADGDMTLTGTLTTAGPTCSTGCDRVFAPGYAIASIDAHSAAMWQAGYLPALGSTVPGAPVNLTDKLGDVINELEHAHIYIDELHGRLAAQEVRLARQDAALQALTETVEAMRAE